MSPQSFKIVLSDSLVAQVVQFAKGLRLTDPEKAEAFFGDGDEVGIPEVLAYLTGPTSQLVSRPLALNKARAIVLCAAGKVSPSAYAAVYGAAGTRNSHREVKVKAVKAPPAPTASAALDILACPPAAPVAPPALPAKAPAVAPLVTETFIPGPNGLKLV